MWQVEIEQQEQGRRQYWRWHHDGEQLSFSGFLDGLLNSEGAREVLLQVLRDTPYIALRWETPPLNAGNLNRAFECVVHDAPGLDVPADTRDFSDYFDEGEVVCFDNLGADARLVVPCSRDPSANYSHLLSFVRTASVSQQHSFLQNLAAETLRRVGEPPLWLNTAGGGVDWLHARLDQRPKYYHYEPFRIWTS